MQSSRQQSVITVTWLASHADTRHRIKATCTAVGGRVSGGVASAVIVTWPLVRRRR